MVTEGETRRALDDAKAAVELVGAVVSLAALVWWLDYETEGALRRESLEAWHRFSGGVRRCVDRIRAAQVAAEAAPEVIATAERIVGG